LAKILDGAALHSSRVQLAIIKTTKIGSFPLPGIEKLSPPKSNSPLGHNPATRAEIKIPAKTVVKMWE
jgi:nucleoid DNA-binding protein